MNQHVTTFYRDPFSIGSPTVNRFKPGMRISEMVRQIPNLPRDFAETGVVQIDGHEVPRALWHLVKPKAIHAGVPVNVTFHARIGGGEGGKSPLAIIASIALVVVSTALANPEIGLAASLGLSTTQAAFAGIAISLIGNLAIRALTPPPSGPDGPEGASALDRDKNGSASANGNVLEPNGPIPRVVGTRKIFPPLAAEPFVYYDGQDEFVQTVYALAGPHKLEDIRIDGTAIAEATDLEFEVREGWLDDEPLNIPQQQTRTAQIQLAMSQHAVLPNAQDQLENTFPASLPKFHGASGRNNPDRILLHLLFGSGLGKSTVTGAGDQLVKPLRVPFRIRIRRSGDTAWRNLPELHYEHATLRDARATINLIFQDGENIDVDSAPFTANFVEARFLSPGQTEQPATAGWTADPYFDNGAGADYLALGTESTTRVANVTLTNKAVNIFLDKAQFLPGLYEIEMMRGNAFLKENYAPGTYFYNGGVKDFFTWRDVSGNPTIPETRENVIDQVHIMRAVSVWDEPPVKGSGFALIAIRALNRRIERVSVKASGYVKDWDGTGWNTWITTSNPAPHYRDALIGRLNLDPLPETLIDEQSLVGWRTASAALDYTCDHIAEGQRLADVLQTLAGCGFARPFQSETWGVIRDYDRSSEGPVQIFSPRNSSGLEFSKEFSRLPDGLRVNFQFDETDFTNEQMVVYRNDVPGTQLEQVNYQGLTTVEKARRRAEFDLAQSELRAVSYTLNTGADSIVCRRGSLVGVQHDVLEDQAGFGRVLTVITSGGNVTGLVLDSEVPVWNEPDMHAVADMHAVTDMHAVGRSSGVAIRQTDGVTTVHPLSNATGETDTLTLATPVPVVTTLGGPFDSATIPKIDTGCLAVTGNLGTEFLRLIVSKIEARPDLTARLTLIDEAPELWSAA